MDIATDGVVAGQHVAPTTSRTGRSIAALGLGLAALVGPVAGAGTATAAEAPGHVGDAAGAAVSCSPTDRDGDGIPDAGDPEPDNPFNPGDQDHDGDIDAADAANERDGGPGSTVQQAEGLADRDDDGVSDRRDPAPDDPRAPGDRDHDGDVDGNDAYLATHPRTSCD